MDGVEKASSGHPGLPMGLAEVGSLIYGEFMNHYPGDWQWPNRDRFVLSAGHGSMLLYSLLHLSGYPLTVEDLRKFRQAGSKTPGHPEYGHTIGVETTTGPLGQGVSNAVGMAIAEAHLAATYNTPEHKIVDHYVYAIASDGDLMEGVSAEACSLAGHLGLGKIIVFYDDNKISIEGSTDLAFTEDPVKRFEAYGWQTMRGDAYDVDGIQKMVAEAKKDLNRPTFIALSSVIGKGSPNKAGTHGVHGAKLGSEEIAIPGSTWASPRTKSSSSIPTPRRISNRSGQPGRKPTRSGRPSSTPGPGPTPSSGNSGTPRTTTGCPS